MKLEANPKLTLPVFQDDLELIVAIKEAGIPEVIVEPGSPRPDRHLVLGLAQSAAMAISERDAEVVEIVDECTLKLVMADEERDITPDMVIVRSRKGGFGTLTQGDAAAARRRSREALRYFTGTVRLDVP